MNIGNIINFDSGNARGLSTVVFVSGCTHACPECHNKIAWDFEYGVPLYEKLDEICSDLSNPHIKNLVISGGDPLHPKNLEGVVLLLTAVIPIIKEYNQNIILYTGYTFKDLQERKGIEEEYTALILQSVDYLIDGPYIKEKKTKKLDYRGSTNQKCWRRGELGWYDYSDFYFKTEVEKSYNDLS